MANKIFGFTKVTFSLCFCFLAAVSRIFSQNIPEEDMERITQAVEKIYQTNAGEVKVFRFTGGHSGDRLYEVIYGDEVSVTRVHNRFKSLERRKRDALCSQIAFDLGVGPEVLYVSQDFYVLVTARARGKHPDITTFDDIEMVENLALSLKKIHNGPAFILPWNVYRVIRNSRPKGLDDEIKLAFSQLDEIEQGMEEGGFAREPTHNDIHPGNMFVDKKNIYFIDWGDAGMGDPYFDLARASIEFAFYPKKDEVFLSSYFGEITDLILSHFFLMKQVFILKEAMNLHTREGEVDRELMRDIFEIFKAQAYLLPFTESEVVTWQDLSEHLVKLYLRNTRTATFEKSLKTVKGAAGVSEKKQEENNLRDKDLNTHENQRTAEADS